MINEVYRTSPDSDTAVARIKAHKVWSSNASLLFRKNLTAQQVMEAGTRVAESESELEVFGWSRSRTPKNTRSRSRNF